jgi:AraC-like DNA-binding protein
MPMAGFQKSIMRGVVTCPISQKDSGMTLAYDIEDASLPLAPVKYETWGAHEFSEFMALLDEAANAQRMRVAPTLPAIENAVRRAIASGEDNEEAVAEQLRMSSASLRRRLAEAGLSFRMLLHDERRDLASALLMTDKPLEDIASEMHYSDVRSFRRACYRWLGMPPGAYRASKSNDD